MDPTGARLRAVSQTAWLWSSVHSLTEGPQPPGQSVPMSTRWRTPTLPPVAPWTPHPNAWPTLPTGATVPEDTVQPRPDPEGALGGCVTPSSPPPWSSRGPRLTVHTGGPGSRGARDLPLSARAASCLPGNRPPRLAAVPVQCHNLTGASGQLTCKRGADVG